MKTSLKKNTLATLQFKATERTAAECRKLQTNHVIPKHKLAGY